MRYSRGRGFTLLEVLVAMAVLAIGLGAVIQTASSGIQGLALQRDRTIAGWVAANVLNTQMLAARWPGLGAGEGRSGMAGADWHWRLEVGATSDQDLRRIRVQVWRGARAAGEVLADQVAFRGRQ